MLPSDNSVNLAVSPTFKASSLFMKSNRFVIYFEIEKTIFLIFNFYLIFSKNFFA